jgi:hypothetical protein
VGNVLEFIRNFGKDILGYSVKALRSEVVTRWNDLAWGRQRACEADERQMAKLVIHVGKGCIV